MNTNFAGESFSAATDASAWAGVGVKFAGKTTSVSGIFGSRCKFQADSQQPQKILPVAGRAW